MESNDNEGPYGARASSPDKILITGATGYVGSAVAASLYAAGYAVGGLARSEDSATTLEDRGHRAYRGDMGEAGTLSWAISDFGADAVVHAATTGDSEAESADRMMVEDTLDSLRGSGRTFIYTSGGWVMGETPGSPDDPPADEQSPVEPAPSLRWRPAVEERVLKASGSHEIRTFVIRPALVYGNGGGVLAEMVEAARERGVPHYVVGEASVSEPLWTLVYTADLGDLYSRVLEHTGVPGGTMLIAAGAGPTPVRDIAAEASRLHGFGAPPEPWPLTEARVELGEYADSLALSQRLSGAKARRLLGWVPSGPPVSEELATGFSGGSR